jgi:hypothetical protein
LSLSVVFRPFVPEREEAVEGVADAFHGGPVSGFSVLRRVRRRTRRSKRGKEKLKGRGSGEGKGRRVATKEMKEMKERRERREMRERRERKERKERKERRERRERRKKTYPTCFYEPGELGRTNVAAQSWSVPTHHRSFHFVEEGGGREKLFAGHDLVADEAEAVNVDLEGEWEEEGARREATWGVSGMRRGKVSGRREAEGEEERGKRGEGERLTFSV